MRIKKHIKTIIVSLAVVLTIGVMQVSATAATYYVYLPVNSSVNCKLTKSSGTDELQYRLYSVYPTGSYLIDTYSKIKISANCGTNTLMSTRTVREGSGLHTYSYADDLSANHVVTFVLEGNNSSQDAYAHIYLNVY